MKRSLLIFSSPSIRTVATAGWRYYQHGDPGKVLRYEKFRVPFERNGSDVVVKMLAAPVHRHDKNVIEGVCPSYLTTDITAPKMFPRVAGVEGVGVVEEVGTGATLGLKEGDLVWVNSPTVGTWATHIVTKAENLDVMPNRADVDIEYLASMSLFHTAHH